LGNAVQIVRCGVGFRARQILLVQMTVDHGSPSAKLKSQGLVVVVRVDDWPWSEIEGVVAGNVGHIRVEQLFFFVRAGVVDNCRLCTIAHADSLFGSCRRPRWSGNSSQVLPLISFLSASPNRESALPWTHPR